LHNFGTNGVLIGHLATVT